MSGPAFAYDIVDYPSHPQPQAHPARLAAIARLHGIPTASPARCRYLEVGCGEGATLLPLALAYPESTFVGIDLSGVAIARGEALRKAVGLPNLTLVAADLTTWDPGPKPFDYVMAHGFYSWVPPFVRDVLLALCRDRLTPSGVAYVSYNALPGCHVRRMLWEMLRFHVRDITDPQQKISQAIAMIQFLAKGVYQRGAYADLMREELRRLENKAEPFVMFHDDLSDINDPVTITDFVAHARRFGLEFLAEADYFEMTADVAPGGTSAVLHDLARRDIILKEQYLDFLKGRRFRQTVLCRAAAPMRREPDAAAALEFAAVGEIKSEPSPADLSPGVPVQFRGGSGSAVTIDQAAAKAALARVGESFPRPVPVAEILADRAVTPADRQAVMEVLTAGYRVGLVDFFCDPPQFVTTAGPRPRISRLVRAQLDAEMELVTSLRPSVVRLENPITRELVQLLDGTRDQEALLADLANRAAADPRFTAPGDSPQPAAWWRDRLAPQIEGGLASVARMALLEE
jgi:SAM-dependent methyltransferase